MPRKYKKGQAVMIYVVFIIGICTLPLLLWLISVPLEFLAFIGEIGESIFGNGNAIIFLIILMLAFAGFLAWIIKLLENQEKKQSEKENKEL